MKKLLLLIVIVFSGTLMQAQTGKHIYTYNDVNIDSIKVHVVQLYTTITTLKYGFVMGLKFGMSDGATNGNYHWKDRNEQILKVDGKTIDMENNNPAYILNILYECGFKLVGQSSNQIQSGSAWTWIYYTLAR